MRKLTFVLLGLALLGGAIAMFGYRWVYEPQRAAKMRAAQPSPSAQAPRASGTNQPKSGASSGTQTTAAPSAWQTAEFVMNGLNIVVGIIGIWMTWLGIRMQRTMNAMQAEQQRRGLG